METITLNNGVEMPLLGLGTFKTAGDECVNSVRTAIEAGYQMIDTAEGYKNEEQVGQGIAESGIDRKQLFIVTKVSFRSFENAREAVLSSLKKLRTDYLDLVLLHWPFGNYYAAWRELEKFYAEGIIRAIGVSNFEPDRLIDIVSFNKVVPAVNQIETHLFCQRQVERKWMEKYNVRPMAYAPLGQARRNEMFTLPEVTALAEKYSRTPAQILLHYLIQLGIVVIPKSVHEERIKENFNVFGFELTAAEMETLRALDTASPMVGTPAKPEKVEMFMPH
ncbi:MAG: aldo/keto reductase [Victivallales bacterium]|nr:aldo/keto reductase [Victivallales bacterium]